MHLGKIGFRHLAHNKQNGQLTCSSVQAEQFQWCTPLFFMDLSVQIDLTLVAQFISLLIFYVWSFINLMLFYVVKIWTSRGNDTCFAISQYFPSTCRVRGAPPLPDWQQTLAFQRLTWQATPLALKPRLARAPLPRVLPRPSSPRRYRAYHL